MLSNQNVFSLSDWIFSLLNCIEKSHEYKLRENFSNWEIFNFIRNKSRAAEGEKPNSNFETKCVIRSNLFLERMKDEGGEIEREGGKRGGGKEQRRKLEEYHLKRSGIH